ncbi:MAG: flagellar biosynthesis regulator FlaF [Oceanibaculum nanhaiense]|uniref:flagellar biosynthesis regulator FlaF n=1 Tax=Oceanibaculum nanhaiense TaxID=1909734 RepID=UPI0025A48F34|nr:flagellar biosynthesis regulator FlaF [Oceanibaculum nanhaiense]MDM7947703.1 flagellar biosynthesis regulator FlaF [Oceanibaculum nanhaiense]
MVGNYGAYQRTNSVTENPRALEYRLLGMVTAAMIEAEKKPKPALHPARVDAAYWNKQIWDHLMVDLTHEDNKLPKELRVSLVNIGIWVNKETRSVMDRKSDCSTLIEINQIIMQGLKPPAVSVDEEQGKAASSAPASSSSSASPQDNFPAHALTASLPANAPIRGYGAGQAGKAYGDVHPLLDDTPATAVSWHPVQGCPARGWPGVSIPPGRKGASRDR